MKKSLTFACAGFVGLAVMGCQGESSQPTDQPAPSTEQAAKEITDAADNATDDAAQNANTQEP